MRKIQVKTSKKQVNKGPKWLFKGFKGHSSKIQVLKVLKVMLLPLKVLFGRNVRKDDRVVQTIWNYCCTDQGATCLKHEGRALHSHSLPPLTGSVTYGKHISLVYYRIA